MLYFHALSVKQDNTFTSNTGFQFLLRYLLVPLCQLGVVSGTCARATLVDGPNVLTLHQPRQENRLKFRHSFWRSIHFCKIFKVRFFWCSVNLISFIPRKKYKYVERQRVIPSLVRTIRNDHTEEVSVKKEKYMLF